MDKIVIETEATSAFKTVIRRNPYLSPYIDENDKTPVWDGHVYVYSTDNASRNNQTLLGRVPTQIKGHNTSNGFPKEITYRINKSDLISYQSEGGIVFIVVYINDEFKSQIYYEQLLGLDIERLKAKMKNQKSKNINLRHLPSDNVQAANIFLNFIENRKKQTGTVDEERLNFSDWEKNSEIDTYMLHISSVTKEKFHPLQALSMAPFYLYAKPKHFNLEIPMERVNQSKVLTTNIHEIGSNQKVYFTRDETKSIWENGNLRIEFGKILSLHIDLLPENRVSGKFSFKLRGTLNEVIDVSDFMLAVLENKSITINGISMNLNFDELDGFEGALQYVTDLVKIRYKLDELRITSDLYINKLDEKEIWLLKLLLEINEDQEDVYLKKYNQISILKISNIQLTIFSIEKEGKFYVRDFFFTKENLLFSAETREGQQQAVSRFLLLKENSLCSSNLFAEHIYLDLIKYDTWEEYHLSVNLFLLECLKAYDSSQGNSSELLKLANLIISWLVSKDSKSSIYKLNFWQTKLRERPLFDYERTAVEVIATDGDEPWAVRCGAMILLGNFDEVSTLLIQQPKKDQDEFMSFPIYTIMKSRIHEST